MYDIRTFGGFEVAVDGAPLDLSGVRPRARTLLRLLAVQGGRPLHRDAIQAALWPAASVESATQTLHVAIYALRRTLAPAAARGEPPLLLRDGGSYRLAAPPSARVDVVTFDAHLRTARRARQSGDADLAPASLQ